MNKSLGHRIAEAASLAAFLSLMGLLIAERAQ
jgi:hypothetical protein